MHTLVPTINLHISFEMSSFTGSKNTMEAPEFKNGQAMPI